MNPRNLAHAKNPDLYNSYAALRRAARLARETAIQTDTGIVVRRNGKMTHVSARELRQQSGE